MVEWTAGGRLGEDAKDFIWTLTYTGLRISDVALFNINRLHGNEVYLRAKKNGGDVFAYIPDWLRDRLMTRSKTLGSMVFLVGESRRLDTVTDTWRRKLHKVFELAGKFEENPTPHRFRHTFARILLQRGVPAGDVADLLGDDEDTVREHYARWVPERQARLTKILQEAFEDKPKPKLVAIRGGKNQA
jgi:integrase